MKNKKELGQNWLKDRVILDEIADEARGWSAGHDEEGDFSDGVSRGEAGESGARLCVEIGPGLGTLTSSLLRRFEKVLAVEFDERLATNLPKSFPGKNLEVVNADILGFDFGKIDEPFVVAGNIPYYITSPILTKLLTLERKPERIVLLIQKEVAERVLAEMGDQTYLSLFVQNYAEVRPGIVVPREYFTPPPKVDSATIIMVPRKKPVVGTEVLDFIKMGFQNPRKKLLKNLGIPKERGLEIFEELGISENARPEDLGLEMWGRLRERIRGIEIQKNGARNKT